MPRVNLGRTCKPPVRYQDTVSSVIRAAMARNGLRSQRALAVDMRMSEPDLSKRLSGTVDWKLSEILKLNKLLDFTDEEAILLIKGAKK
jgi:ribosome-binding protein aMBF1 (putative translation factor)